jgi:hypothetical protein
VSVANAADGLAMESAYQISALIAFFTDKIVSSLGLESIEWKSVTLLKILIRVPRPWTGNLERRQNRFYFSTRESGSLYSYAVSWKLH